MVSAQGQEANDPRQRKQSENSVGTAARLEPGIISKFISHVVPPIFTDARYNLLIR